MKDFKPLIIIILGLICLSLFFATFFILINEAEKQPKKYSQNIEEREHKLIKQQ